MQQPIILPIPHTKEPFVNTLPIFAGFNPETGAERYFISSWNANVGCSSVLVDTDGNCRTYRFHKANQIYAGCGGYSAVLTDPDTIWLCSDLGMPVRLTLSTGEYQFFESGARNGLVFSGMQYDAATKKLMAISCQLGVIMGLSFDTETQQAVRYYDGFTKATYLRGGFANPDGKTYTMRLITNFSALYQWDPVAETLTERCEIDERSSCLQVITGDDGRVYIPYMGWLNTADYTFSDGPRPDREMCWFGRIGTNAYGVKENKATSGAEIYVWDMTTGSTRLLCTLPDGVETSVTMSKQGEIIGVNIYGVFHIFDPVTGALLMSRDTQVRAPGQIYCMLRYDDTHILGAPYITQRFWLLDTETGAGFDAGRAAPSDGEVIKLWNMAGKVYMASYTEGILTEYDPQLPIAFPENPRIVAQAPNGMRPYAKANDERYLYYSCNHHYGHYGCVLTRYDTKTGRAFYHDDPIPLQKITALHYNDAADCLYGSTSTYADGWCLPPSKDRCALLRIDPKTLCVTDQYDMEENSQTCTIVGQVEGDTYLISKQMTDGTASCFLYSFATNEMTDFQFPAGVTYYEGTAHCGLFMVIRDGEMQLWRMTKNSMEVLETIPFPQDTKRHFVDDDTLYLITPTQIYMYADLFSPHLPAASETAVVP